MRAFFTPAIRRLLAVVIATMLALAAGAAVGMQDDTAQPASGGMIGALDHLDQ